MRCTCGVNDEMERQPHEAWCGMSDCGKCGQIGAHSEANCPEFRELSCCGADTRCRLCPFEVRRAVA